MKPDALLKIEFSINAMKVLIDGIQQGKMTPDNIDDLRTLTSRNLELLGGNVCDLCGDSANSTTVCWSCWTLECKKEETKMIKLNGQISILVYLLQRCEWYLAETDDDNFPAILRSHIQHELRRYKDMKLDLKAINEFRIESINCSSKGVNRSVR